jgi:hypothetical protein
VITAISLLGSMHCPCFFNKFPVISPIYFPARSLLRFQAESRLPQCLCGVNRNPAHSTSQNSLYFSLLTGILPQRRVRGRLRPPPASLLVRERFSDSPPKWPDSGSFRD